MEHTLSKRRKWPRAAVALIVVVVVGANLQSAERVAEVGFDLLAAAVLTYLTAGVGFLAAMISRGAAEEREDARQRLVEGAEEARKRDVGMGRIVGGLILPARFTAAFVVALVVVPVWAAILIGIGAPFALARVRVVRHQAAWLRDPASAGDPPAVWEVVGWHCGPVALTLGALVFGFVRFVVLTF